MYTGGTTRRGLETELKSARASMFRDAFWSILLTDRRVALFFQNTTLVWPARRRTSGGNRCIGTSVKARNAGRFSSLPATASLFGRSSTKCSTSPKIDEPTPTRRDCWVKSVFRIARDLLVVIWNSFYKNKCCYIFWYNAVVVSYNHINERKISQIASDLATADIDAFYRSILLIRRDK